MPKKRQRPPVDVVHDVLKNDRLIKNLLTGSQSGRLASEIIEALEKEGWAFTQHFANPKPAKTDPKFSGSDGKGW